jgi:DNA-binding PadR family transcriptional regulator
VVGVSGRVRRSSSDCTRIAVLGLLCRHGARHGYELRQLIRAQHIDDISDVQLGSIYATLKRLVADGAVEPAGTAVERGPARTSYRITAVGRKELRRLLEGAFVDPEQPERPIDLAIHFSGLLPVNDVVELLTKRIDALRAYRRRARHLVTTTEHPDPAVGELIAAIGDHFLRVNEIELDWSKRMLAQVRRGAFRTGAMKLSR